MTLAVALMLALMGLALVAFVTEALPIEVTALGLLAILTLVGILDVEEALSGFSSGAAVAVASLLVLSHALTKTGLLETVADRFGDRARRRPWLMVVVLLVLIALGSGALNNTAVVALSIPLVMKLSRQLGLSPSKVLIPVSYASILGGTLTLIGTSTNLLVNAIVIDAGERPIGVFEATGPAGLLMVAGLLYIVLAARRVLPGRADSAALTRKYEVGSYLTELILEPGSRLVGHTLSEARVNQNYGVTVIEVVRQAEETHVDDVEAIALQPGDHLVVQGALDDILRMRREEQLTLIPDVHPDDAKLAAGGQALVEAWVTPGSQMVGRTLKELDFHHHFGGYVLAVRRIGATLCNRVADVSLRFADALLILVPRGRLASLEDNPDLAVLSEHEFHLRRRRFWWLVLLVLPGAVVAAATGAMDIAGSALIGAVALLAFGAISPDEAYRAINWPVVLMIAAFVPVGHAFQTTGTAGFLARGLLAASSWTSPSVAPYAVLAMTYLATFVLTQIASNNAAAIIVAPIALSLGPALGVSSRPFIFAVCFAASAAFMTPMGYQTNLMVYAAGQYRFTDFSRFGAPLSLILWVLSVVLIPVFWPW